MDLLAVADRLVIRSGLYRLTMIDRPRPRTLRWTPLVTLAALWTGLLILPIRPHVGWGSRGITGMLLFFGAFGLSTYLRFFGPRLDGDPRHPLDEREQALRARALAWSGSLFTLVACAGCFYMGAADLLAWPRPSGIAEWIYLGLALQATAQILPVLFASWLGPRIGAEE